MMRVVMMTEMSRHVNEVSRDMTGEADGMNQGVDSRDRGDAMPLANY